MRSFIHQPHLARVLFNKQRRQTWNAQYTWLGDTLTGTPANIDFSQWTDSGAPHTIESDAFLPNGRHLHMDLTINTNTLGKLSLVPDHTNVSVLYIASTQAVDGATTRNLGFAIQASGDGSNKVGYRLYFDATSAILARFVANTSTNITSGAFAVSLNTPYAIRFVRIGSALRVKAWAWGVNGLADEPGAWLIDTTDTNISTAGCCGPYVQRGIGSDDYHYISVQGGGFARGP